MRRYLRDPTFSRFDTIPECDGHIHTQTDRQTDRHTTTAYTALSKASRGKNDSLRAVIILYVGRGRGRGREIAFVKFATSE